MSTPEERLGRLDPCRAATYRHPDPVGMVDRILDGTRRRPRRRAIVLAPVLTAVAGGATALGLLLTAATPATSLPALVLAGSSRHGTTFAARPGYGTATVASSGYLSSLAPTPLSARLVTAPALKDLSVHRAPVYLLVAPRRATSAAVKLATSFGLLHVAVVGSVAGVFDVNAPNGTLSTSTSGDPAAPLVWTFDAKCAARACQGSAAPVSTSYRSYQYAPVIPASLLHQRDVAVPLGFDRASSAQNQFEFNGKSLVHARGYLGTTKREGDYPLVGVGEAVSRLRDAFAPRGGKRAPRVVLEAVSLAYVAVELRGGRVAVVPAYSFRGSDGLQWVVVALPSDELRAG